jgi:hypothetical protein
MTDELLGSDAATSTRPEKGPANGAGPMGVQLLALNTSDGEGPPLTRSLGRPTINKMETEKTIQLLSFRIKKPQREYFVRIGIRFLLMLFNGKNVVIPL